LHPCWRRREFGGGIEAVLSDFVCAVKALLRLMLGKLNPEIADFSNKRARIAVFNRDVKPAQG